MEAKLEDFKEKSNKTYIFLKKKTKKYQIIVQVILNIFLYE
jgi:hypothetical protein